MFTRTCLNSGRKCSETNLRLIVVSNVYDLNVPNSEMFRPCYASPIRWRTRLFHLSISPRCPITTHRSDSAFLGSLQGVHNWTSFEASRDTVKDEQKRRIVDASMIRYDIGTVSRVAEWRVAALGKWDGRCWLVGIPAGRSAYHKRPISMLEYH